MPGDIILAALIGVSIGFIGGYAGIAGAPFLVFLLTALMGYTQHEAQGTVLAMMLGPMSLFATIRSWDLIKPRLRQITICIITYALASFIGGLLAYLFASADLQMIFGYLLVIIGIVYATLIIERRLRQRKVLPLKTSYVAVLGIIIGLLGGLFGIGAGVLLVPIFTAIFGFGQNEARAMSLAILLPPVSLGAVVKYGLIETDVYWTVALTLLLSYLLLNGTGAALGHRHHPDLLKRVLGILLSISGLLLILRAS